MVTMLGIDLSLTATGLAVYHPEMAGRTRHDSRYLATYTLSSDSKYDHSDPARWDQILNQIWPFVDRSDACLAVVEGTYPSMKSKVQASLASLRSVLIYGLAARGAMHVSVQPSTLKVYATGNGSASKPAVLKAVRQRYGHLLPIANDNEADALTLLAMAFDHYNWPLVDVPRNHRLSLDTLTTAWPQLHTKGTT